MLAAAACAAFGFSAAAVADDYVITEKDKKFSPEVLTIPAGQKVKVTVKNLDATPAEFESSDFDREKVVNANSEITVFIGPIDAGSYGYFDDFHRESTGKIVVK
jgi:plastocyanin